MYVCSCFKQRSEWFFQHLHPKKFFFKQNITNYIALAPPKKIWVSKVSHILSFLGLAFRSPVATSWSKPLISGGRYSSGHIIASHGSARMMAGRGVLFSGPEESSQNVCFLRGRGERERTNECVEYDVHF